MNKIKKISEVSEEEKSLKATEYLGYKNVQILKIGDLICADNPDFPDSSDEERIFVKNFCKSLDTIQEVIMSLDRNIRDLYNIKLQEITEAHFDYSELESLDNLVNATAAQRVDAFLLVAYPQEYEF